MIKKKIVIDLKEGLHIRPAKEFVKVASQYKSEVSIAQDTRTANGKSILGIMSMAVKQGAEITLIVEGPDEQEASSSLEKILVEQEG
jgi:catabolite repression HPr-like protein